jgi:hypothetical protein
MGAPGHFALNKVPFQDRTVNHSVPNLYTIRLSLFGAQLAHIDLRIACEREPR